MLQQSQSGCRQCEGHVAVRRVPFSVLGTPAISIPGSAHGLPVGVQLVGIGCDVGALLAIAESLTR